MVDREWGIWSCVSCVLLLQSRHQSADWLIFCGDFAFIRLVYSRDTDKKQGEREKGNDMFESILINGQAI